MAFQKGETRLRVQLRNVAGAIGTVGEIIVRSES
jgi:hypothetical protein